MLYLILCIGFTVLLGFLFKISENLSIRITKVIIINYICCICLGALYLGQDLIVDYSDDWFVYAIIMGFLFIVGFNLFAKTILVAGLSLSTLFQKMSVLITVITACMLGESTTFMQWVGILLALISFLFIFYDPKKLVSLSSLSTLSLLGFSLVVSATIEIGFILLRSVKNTTDQFAVILSSYIFLFAAIFGIFFELIKKFEFRFSIKEIIIGLAIGVPNFFSIFTLVKSLEGGMKASVFFPFLNCSVILLSALLSFTVFKEKFSTFKWIGLGIAVIAIYLIQANAH